MLHILVERGERS